MCGCIGPEPFPNQLNLCVEVWDYKPVAEKTILSLLDKASKNEVFYQDLKGDLLS
jgi:calcineurin-like phosphoesterase family protein